MSSDFKYGTDGLTYEEHIKRYGPRDDPNHDKRMSGELPRLDIPNRRARGRTAKPINHGTFYAYRERGCRCEECVEAMKKTNQRRKTEKNKGMHGILSWAIKHQCTCKACQDVLEKMEIENAKRSR